MPRKNRPPFRPVSNKNLIRADVIVPNVATAYRYYRQIGMLIDAMSAEVELEIKNLFHDHTEFFAQDASISSQARVLTNALVKKFDKLFADRSKKVAKNFVDDVDKTSDNAVKGAVKKLSGGLTFSSKDLQSGVLNQILSATITDNVALIKSIPQQYLTGVQSAVMRSITTGNGLADLVPYLSKHKSITLRRARMIAYDQTRKAMNNLSKGRMQGIGVEEYEWIHVASNHPRKYHEAMAGKIYRFDNPPVIDPKTGERGIPGQLVNCRCKMRPVMNFNKTEKE